MFWLCRMGRGVEWSAGTNNFSLGGAFSGGVTTGDDANADDANGGGGGSKTVKKPVKKLKLI